MNKHLILDQHMGSDGQRLSDDFVHMVLDSIFASEEVRNTLKTGFAENDLEFENLEALIGRLRAFLATNIEAMMQNAGFGALHPNLPEEAIRLAAFEQRYLTDSRRYNINHKANPDALMWPNPTHPSHPRSLTETLPFVENLGLIDRTTPIGSAGSCFASEIAYYLQRNDFNYIVTEHDPGDGELPESCARWGILFNTPSFRQLAEKAFGLRQMPRLAEYAPYGEYWQDPFRENITFGSVEDLQDDHDSHLANCRAALLKSRVFIITLGLNECWRFIPDGSVASRNPKSPLHYALFRHQVLSVDENVAALQAFLDILRANNPEIELIVTVSPVPFLATGLADTSHVVTANAHSKAVLRVAAEQFIADNTGVHYFPSYEMVTHCIADPWEPDQRHVSRPAVAQVMALFEKMFVKA